MVRKLSLIHLETDVLVIGGGLAGCMAAIKARESELRVTVVEKANTLRSGCAGVGIDHLWAYIPPVHEKMGWSLDDLVEDHTSVIARGFISEEMIHLVATQSYERVLDLEKFGLNFRYEDSNVPGGFRIVNQFHSVPSSFNFDGRDIKVKLTQEARKRGVRIINRVMVTDLLVSGGRIAGALGVETRTGQIYVFRTKAAVLSTGRTNRLSRNLTGTDFNLKLPPHLSGDGKAMALRAGLEIINMEFIEPRALGQGANLPAGGAPRGTYFPAGAIVGAGGRTIAPRTQFYDWENLGKKKIDPVASRREFATRYSQGFVLMYRLTAMHNEGDGPFYLDLTGGSEDEIRRIEWALGNEGKCWLFLKHLQEEGIDLRRDKIEYVGPSTRDMRAQAAAGLLVNKDLETGIEGFFAAGDEVGGLPYGSGPAAITMGWSAGGSAAKRASEQPGFLPVDGEKIGEFQALCTAILTKQNGDGWKEAELAVQNIVDFYRGDSFSGPLVRRGMERLQEIRENVSLGAAGPHELWRCLEVQSILTNAELLLRASMERKETRKEPFGFKRVDYPDQDDENYAAFLAVSREKGRFKFSKVPIRVRDRS